jgi:hypothetical protein
MNALAEAPAGRRRWGAIAWPAFVAACALEIIVFAAFDPADFHAFGAESWQRESVLSIAFLAFWCVTTAAGYVTWHLAREP